jgi:hypothetical protein
MRNVVAGHRFFTRHLAYFGHKLEQLLSQ